MNKFFAKRTEYNGRAYHSKAEAQFASELDLMRHVQGKDRVAGWEPQFKIPLVANGITVGHIIVDFFVEYVDGRKELVEVKSPATMTPLFKFKKKFLDATWLQDHPNINYRIVQ